MRTAIFLLLLSVVPARAGVKTSDKTYEQLRILVDVLDYVQQNYVDEPDTQKLIYGAASGMIETLDPFSQFMEPDIHKELKNETEGEYGGLGIRIGFKDDWLTVVTPLPGSPAYKLGILPNDRVVEIDHETTKNITMSDALRKLKGAPGSKVHLSIMRGQTQEEDEDGPWTTHEFDVVRENIKIESVQSKRLEGDVGYVRITEFSARTTADFMDALEDLKKQGAKALILDLRNNPGGLLSSAVEVASAFIAGNKLIVYTQGRKLEKPQEFRSNPRAPYAETPLVVLVNEGSASGSEIVAGALQDHHRAVILGMRSYGKASVQSVIPLADQSGLRLTVARYYTPAGRSIQRDEKKKTGGISPDIAVPVTRETEAKLYTQWELIYAKDKKPKSAVKKEDMVRDEVLEKAEELLKAREALGALRAKEG
jgi:carboxyl-terminal processing protease